MDSTPAISRFDDFYRRTTPPWVIGEPQPALVDLEGPGFGGRVLDVGCGTGSTPSCSPGWATTCSASTALPRRSRRPGANAEVNGVGGTVRGRRRDELFPTQPQLRHHRRQRAVPHLRRHRPAEIRREPAQRVPARRRRARARAFRRGPRIRAASQRGDHPRRVQRRLGS